MKHILLIITILLTFLCSSAQGAVLKFSCTTHDNQIISDQDVTDWAKFDLLTLASRFHSNNTDGGTYDTTFEYIKSINAGIKIFIYIDGTAVWNYGFSDCDASSINEWGPVCLGTGSDETHFQGSFGCVGTAVRVLFGYGAAAGETNTKWPTYWYDSAKGDKNNFAASGGCFDGVDGIFGDEMQTPYVHGWGSGYDDAQCCTGTDCDDGAEWDCFQKRMNWFISEAAKLLHADSVELMPNFVSSYEAAFLAQILDSTNNDDNQWNDTPDYGMLENPWSWFGNPDDNWTMSSEAQWLRAVEAIRLSDKPIVALTRIANKAGVTWGTNVDTSRGSIPFNQLVYWLLGTFSLATDGTDFFGIDERASGGFYSYAGIGDNWGPIYDEAQDGDNLDIGTPSSAYSTGTSGPPDDYDELYWRRFANGWVVVNYSASANNVASLNTMFGTTNETWKPLTYATYADDLGGISPVNTYNFQPTSSIWLRDVRRRIIIID